MLNKPFKSTIKKAYTISAADDVTAHIAAGGSASSYSMDKHIGALRNNGLAWVMAGWERMRQLETSVLAGYKDAGTLRAFDPTFQRRAANELERLFNTAAQPEADDAEAGSNEELEAFSDHSEEDSEDEGWAADRGLDVVQTALRTKLRNSPPAKQTSGRHSRSSTTSTVMRLSQTGMLLSQTSQSTAQGTTTPAHPQPPMTKTAETASESDDLACGRKPDSCFSQLVAIECCCILARAMFGLIHEWQT